MYRYSRIAILLHWLMAVLIVGAFVLGLIMVDIQGITPTKLKYFSWHKWLGVTILGLACMRLVWRLLHAAPPYPASMAGWQQCAANGLHGLLFVLIFAVPISGYLYSLAAGVPVLYLGIVPLPVLIEPNQEWKPILKLAHYSSSMGLLGGFCLHVLAALKHHFIDRDGILKRILP